MRGPLREDLTRISTRSSVQDLYRIMQGPLERNLAGSPQEPFMWQFTLKMSQGKSLRTPWRGLCASLRSRNAHGHLRRAISCDNLQEKCRAPEVSRTFCASLRSRNALGHLARASLCENLLQKKRKADDVPWSTPGLNSYPRCGHTVWGKDQGKRTKRHLFFALLLLLRRDASDSMPWSGMKNSHRYVWCRLCSDISFSLDSMRPLATETREPKQQMTGRWKWGQRGQQSRPLLHLEQSPTLQIHQPDLQM